jgi:hypothetical protein
LQISHGVVGKQYARLCQDCHVPDGIMDFSTMGYTPEEVAVLTSISAESAGQRQLLRMSVVIPAAQPLPTPVMLSGNLEAARGFGVRIPWNPFLVLLVSIGILGGGGYWLYRQRPPAPAGQVAQPAPPEPTPTKPESAPAATAAGGQPEQINEGTPH